jgi:cytochrome c peroxidase
MRYIGIALLLTATACTAGTHAAGGPRVDRAQLQAYGQLPASMATAEHPATPAQVALGRELYFETRLSRDSSISCNSCHPLTAFGADPRTVSFGVGMQAGTRQAPSVYNAAGHLAQFWDGRAPTVEEQAKGPILNPVEMAMANGDSVVLRLRAVAHYRAAFAAAFPGQAEPVTYDNVGLAIGAFERGLVTPSRWDAFQAGDTTALTAQERRGLNEFGSLGCATCHKGVYVGGETYEKVGVVEPWPHQDDQGRYAVTHREGDRMVFKVPSLRNIAQTAPYFHNGRVTSLEEAVRWMARYQMGRTPTDAQVAQVVAWLGSLTGTVPEEYVAQPQP